MAATSCIVSSNESSSSIIVDSNMWPWFFFFCIYCIFHVVLCIHFLSPSLYISLLTAVDSIKIILITINCSLHWHVLFNMKGVSLICFLFSFLHVGCWVGEGAALGTWPAPGRENQKPQHGLDHLSTWLPHHTHHRITYLNPVTCVNIPIHMHCMQSN